MDGHVPAHYRRILDSYQPYVVTSVHKADGCSALAGARLPAGMELPEALHFNPHRADCGPFLDILQRLDECCFGLRDMAMPRWTFYDCAEVPGGIFGFARPAVELPGWARQALRVDDGYVGPVPLSMYMAIPMLEPGAWLGHSLGSLDEVAPGAAPAGLALLTMAAGLYQFGVRTVYGVTQWRSSQLAVCARFAPLELVTAWTPAHTDPRTLTFRFPATAERTERALAADSRVSRESADGPIRGPIRAPIRWIDCDEDEALRALQADIESGRRFHIVGAPLVDGSSTSVPVCELGPD